MALTIVGKAFTKIGTAVGHCDETDLTTPDYCVECRQVTRWTARMVHWFTGDTESKIGAILRAMLMGHDDILAAFCQNCWTQDVITCECLVSRYKSMGLSTTLSVLTGYDDCLEFGHPVAPLSCDAGLTWFYTCTPQMCEVCVERVLDPCANAADETLMQKLFEAEAYRTTHRPTGDNMLTQVALLFDGSTPTFAGVTDEIIYIYIGRDMTPEEVQLREVYASMIPVPEFGRVRFVDPAT